jgi:hypothetical protein
MANPTSNFGWQMPTPTDLVTDLPADFEVFGQAVDTSLADLKGGTTDQVLAKPSNTDMDFKWVTSDDANAIQNAIVDAKGDLIAASAADTPARLAVGGDYGFLQSIGAESTGLKWNDGAWTTYTPTVTAGSGTYTTITVNGGYQRIGKTCIARMYVQVDNKGTADGSILVSLPFQAVGVRQSGTGADVNLNGFAASVLLDSSESKVIVKKYDFTTFWTNSVGVAIQITYEVA